MTGPMDAGMELCGVVESEDELQSWLESAFEAAGWTAIREVRPHSSDYRADLIVQHDRFGWFGIETKYIGSNAGAVDMAKAHHQITQKYRGKKYIGNKIDLWCVCPYIKYANCRRKGDESDEKARQRRQYERRNWNKIHHTRPFFAHSGIGWVNLNHYALSLAFIHSEPGGRVPTTKLAETDAVQSNSERYSSIVNEWFEEVDMQRIREWAQRSVESAQYGRKGVIRSEVEADE